MPETGGQVLKTVLTNGGVIPCGAGLVFLAHSAIRLRFSAARERPPEKDRRKKSARCRGVMSVLVIKVF